MSLNLDFIVINYPRKEFYDPIKHPDIHYILWINGGLSIKVNDSLLAACEGFALVEFSVKILAWLENLSNNQFKDFEFSSFDSDTETPELCFKHINNHWKISSYWQKYQDKTFFETHQIVQAVQIFLLKIDSFLKDCESLAKNTTLKSLYKQYTQRPDFHLKFLPALDQIRSVSEKRLSAQPLNHKSLLEQLEPGLYAKIETSLGTITVKLFSELVPKAVEHFRCLATGVQDSKTIKPFYNGLVFDAVIPGYLIMGGSAQERSVDWAELSFEDEFHPLLRHDQPGILSMQNYEYQPAKGSQFVITEAPAPWLDDWNTVIGRVVGGLNIVRAIASVKRDAMNKPLEPVVIQKIQIFSHQGDNTIQP